MTASIKLHFHCFTDESYYQGGKFQFEIEVPEAYNMVVSISTTLFYVLSIWLWKYKLQHDLLGFG